MAVPFLVPAAIAIASEFLPTLATKLGGKRGRGVAEQVIQIAATVAGTPKDADPREIIAALRKDETKTAEIRMRLEELDHEEHARIVDDRMDARRYQASIGARARIRGTMMLLGVVVGLVAIILAVLWGRADPASMALLTTLAGALLKMLSDAFAFEFGSSSGSKDKDATIEGIQKSLMDAAQSRNAQYEAERVAARAMMPMRPDGGDREERATPDAPGPSGDRPEGDTTVKATVRSRDFVAELVALST